MFNQYPSHVKYGDRMDMAFAYLMYVIGSIVPSFILIALCSALAPLAGVLAGLFCLAFVAFGPVLGKLHPLGRLDKYEKMPNSSLFMYNGDVRPLYSLAEQYYELPDKDRANFPSNFVKLLSNNDLTKEQRDQVVWSGRDTLRAIRNRNAARKSVDPRREVDITAALEYMRDQRTGLEQEAEVYDEFKIKGVSELY
jgi:hypothetical protein